jgi:hypothetical protein
MLNTPMHKIDINNSVRGLSDKPLARFEQFSLGEGDNKKDKGFLQHYVNFLKPSRFLKIWPRLIVWRVPPFVLPLPLWTKGLEGQGTWPRDNW